jgi:hypothetical protein
MSRCVPLAYRVMIDIRHAAVVVALGMFTASCSKTPDADAQKKLQGDNTKAAQELATTAGREQNESQPDQEAIAEDCVGFVRATKVLPAQTAGADCPQCPAQGTEILSFRDMHTDRISCSADTCEVLVTIRASFSPGAGETIGGGMTAWIPAEQRTAYLSGQTPSGDKAYSVKITYRRAGAAWRAIEFARPSPE